jgi:hypothetical protein
MRKKMGFATLMLSILIGVFLIVFPPGRSHFDDNICTPSEYEKIKAERIQTDSLRFIIQFDEQTLLYSKGTNRFYYSLIEGSPTAHNPLIKLVSETDINCKSAFAIKGLQMMLLKIIKKSDLWYIQTKAMLSIH